MNQIKTALLKTIHCIRIRKMLFRVLPEIKFKVQYNMTGIHYTSQTLGCLNFFVFFQGGGGREECSLHIQADSITENGQGENFFL